MSLWIRQVVFEVGQPGTEGISISDLRVSFRIEHTLSGSPSPGTITIYNPRTETVSLFQEPGVVVRLLAGYDVARQIFVGNPLVDGVRSDRRGVDRILNVKAQDGLVAIQGAQVDVTLDTESSLIDILQPALDALGLPLGPNAEIPDIKFPDYTFQGDASDLVDRVAEMGAFQWTVRDGTFVSVAEGSDTGEESPLYSAANGNLIGSPTRKDSGVEITALLDASLRPGMAYRIESAEINGDYTAEKVIFTGDSGFSNPFYMVVTGRERGVTDAAAAPTEDEGGGGFGDLIGGLGEQEDGGFGGAIGGLS